MKSIDEEFDVITSAEKCEPLSSLDSDDTFKPLLDNESAINKPAWEDSDDSHTIPFKKNCTIELLSKCQETTDVVKTVSVQEDNSKSTVSATNRNISISRVCCANAERESRLQISSTDFNRKFELILTTSLDTSLNLFSVDENTTSLLKHRVFEKFPIICAKFSLSGESVILAGKDASNFRVYDINNAVEQRACRFVQEQNEYLTKFDLSQDCPNTLAVCSNTNRIYLVDLRTLDKVCTLEVTGVPKDLVFIPGKNNLSVGGDSGCISVFDIRSSKSSSIIHKWQDEGNFTEGISLAASRHGRWFAVGSMSGIVNVYNQDSTMISSNPKPFKSLDNLTTPISAMGFHPHGEVLCFSSSSSKGAIRLYNAEKQILYENFPVNVRRLTYTTTCSFSPNGKFMSIGQDNGKVHLFHMKDYLRY